MANAVALATAWAGVARGFELVANDGTDAVAKTIDSLTGSLSSVISTLKVLSTFVQEPIQMTTAMGAWAGQLIDYAVALATAWATAAEGFDLVANDGVAALSDTLSSVDDGFAGVIAVLKVLAQFAQEPITLTDQMKTQAGVLAGNAVELATAWATAALGFDMIANDGVGALSDTVGSMADGLEGTIGVLKTLASFVAEPVVLTDAMITAANTLSAQAVELATIWAGVALNFDLVTNDGVGPLADTIGSMSDGLESTIGVLTTLASFVEEPIALTDAMKDAASTLASNALELGTIWAGVAQNFDVIANDGVSALADTISSANDGIGSVVELLNLFASLAEDPVVIVENVGQQMYDLASYAYELGQIFADVAGGFDTIANDGVPALADTISSAADGIASVIEIMQSISTLAERPIPLPQNWTNMAQDILDYARVVADALVEAARGFDEIAGDQAKAMADAAGSAFDAIGSALETFPKMATFLGGFIGLTDGLRTQLRLLMQTIVLVFKEFAQAALDADITQAAQDAAAALSDGFGSAVSALKDAFDLWDTLVGGDAPRMGFNMVNPQAVSALLDPYFDFIEMVFQEFANRAANYDMTDLQAATDLSDAVSSVFDAINSVFEAITSFQGVNAPTYSGGSSGVMNIGQVLDHIFSIFEENVGRGQAVQSIANSLSAAVGAIVAVTAAIAQLPQNVDTADLSAAISAIVAALAPASARMGPLGFEMGTSLGKGIADGIRSQKDDIVAALREVMSSLSSQVATGLSSMVPSGATRTLPPGTLNGGTQGSGGTTVNYNYYTTNNYSLTQNVDPTTAAASSQSFAAMEALS